MSVQTGRLGVVLAAAGSSRRLGFDKLFTPVLGKTVFQYGLERILASPLVAEVVVVTGDANREIVARLLPQTEKPVRVVPGGAERQDSVMAGLAAVDPALEYVMIQDAARPFVTPELIERVFAAALETGAAVCGHPSIDTLKEAMPSGGGESGTAIHAARTLDRSAIWAVQTPQIFLRSLLSEAYAAVASQGLSVTDDTAAVEALGRPVALVPYEGLNIKITRKTDWEIGLRQMFGYEDDVASGGELRKLIHDFSNQITSLLGFAYLIDADCPPDSPLKTSVNCLNESIHKCHQITLTLQKFAREFHSKKLALMEATSNPSPAPPGSSHDPTAGIRTIG